MHVFTYVRVKLPRLTLFRLALELIGTYPPRKAGSHSTHFIIHNNTLARNLRKFYTRVAKSE